MTNKEIDELNLLAQRLLLICAQATIDNQNYEKTAKKSREKFALVKIKKEGYKNAKVRRKD